MGWEAEWWAETMVTEQRYYRDAWAVGTTYAAGAEVWRANTDGDVTYWVSQAGANVGHDPATDDGTWWEEAGAGFVRTIDFEQTGCTRIGRADLEDCVWDRDPRVYRKAGASRPVTLEQRALLVQAEEAPARPWIRYQMEPPAFSVTAWGSGTTYVTGDLVYVAATGHTYRALQGSTNKAPATETAYWVKVEFPWFLGRYARNATVAMIAGDAEARKRAEELAEEEMERLLDVCEVAPGHEQRVAFRR
jgi:PAS domain-containing protein